MRIIAGRHRGRALTAPEGLAVRPTADRARQAVFDMLAHGPETAGRLLPEATVLDAFAGTGAMGIEALSRGAARAWFIEKDPVAFAAIRANLGRIGEIARAKVIRADALAPPPAEMPVTLAFLDPPYGQNRCAPALEALAAKNWFAEDAVIVVEHAADDPVTPPPAFHPFDARRHGKAHFLLLRYRRG
ncbi:MAG: 16S rRNA (guanine(966)-N(2))-methyltransferase RsmD [Alphaproteobacteria bacterium]|nr:16S rRNA (guanine(966)-N(2))-methyltransferase RsmD [Alphaproteobacteria bacterium]